jgi:uncharacterized membrane protein YqiK
MPQAKPDRTGLSMVLIVLGVVVALVLVGIIVWLFAVGAFGGITYESIEGVG